MYTNKKCLKVKELQDNIVVDGLLEKYDDSSQIMMGQVLGGNEELLDKIRSKISYGKVIITFKRVAKVPYFGMYLVEEPDIIDIMSEEEYKNVIKGDKCI